MKTYKFKLYSNHGNRELHKTIEGHASVWNHCVALQRRYYALYGKYISKFRLMKHIGKLKKTRRFAHWNQLPIHSYWEGTRKNPNPLGLGVRQPSGQKESCLYHFPPFPTGSPYPVQEHIE